MSLQTIVYLRLWIQVNLLLPYRLSEFVAELATLHLLNVPQPHEQARQDKWTPGPRRSHVNIFHNFGPVSSPFAFLARTKR